MDRMGTEASLPEDVNSLQHELLRARRELSHVESVLAETSLTCDEQRSRLEKLQAELEWLKRALFGRRSERHVPDPRQGQLFEEAPDEAAPAPVPVEEEEISYRRRRGHGWSKLPAHLPRQEVMLDVPESERTCTGCGREMQRIGEDRSERVDLVPARVWVKVLVRPKYACTCKAGGVKQTPPPPSPTPGGRFDFGLTAYVATSKIVDHLPLYRQQDILARSGLELSRSTLCEIMAGAAELLEPLAWLMRDRLLAGDLLGADDTPVRLLDPSHPQGVRLARFWLFRGFEQAPYNVFYFHESRERDGPSRFLDSFRGVVKVDAYGVDNGVYLGTGGRIVASGCMAHARRKFDEAKSSHPRAASEALAFLQQLYDVEDRAKDLSPDERLGLRRKEASPILERWREWLDVQSASALPKLKLGEAVGYARNQWSSLIQYTGDGRVPIDNNDLERDLRALTIGRKNWLFVGRRDAGPRAAILYTAAASAARHDLDVWAYLRDVLTRLASFADQSPSVEQLNPLLPDVWAEAHPESIRRHRQRERENRSAAKRRRRDKRQALQQARQKTTPG